MFKRLAAVFSALLFLTSATLPCSADTEYESVETDVPTNILVLGDSIASGFGLDGYEDDRYSCASYANILAEEYKSELPDDCGFSLTNLAIDGQKSGELLDSLQSGEYDAQLKEADCILVSIGGNDLLYVLIDILAEAGISADGKVKAEFSLSGIVTKIKEMNSELNNNLEEFDSNIAKIASLIDEKSDGQLILQTQYNPIQDFDKVPALGDIVDEKIGRLNEYTLSHSTEDNYLVCDVAAAFDGRAQELTNIDELDIHPNAEGHRIIAETLDATIRSRKYSYERAVQKSDAAVTEDNTGRYIFIGAGVIVIVSLAGLLIILFLRRSNSAK